MRPETILHNSVSLDGSVVGFEVDMATHYRIAGTFGAQAHLVGSGTALAGIEQFGGLRAETDADLQRPAPSGRPPWVVVDSRGRLLGKLHAFRNAALGDDPIVLVSQATPAPYRQYLAQRDYRHHVVGDARVDLEAALRLLDEQHGVRTLLVDAGPGLNGALIDRGLVDRISLIVMPALVGPGSLRLFEQASSNDVALELEGQRALEPRGIWLHYRVVR